MVRIKDIQNCLYGIAGFRQNVNPNYGKLDSDLTTSLSGLWYDQHPLVTIENISAIAPNFKYYNYPAYAAGTTYAIGDRIVDSNLVYESLVNNNTGNTPASSASQWKKIDLISEYLRNLVNDSSAKLINELFLRKKLSKITKTIFDPIRLYEGTGTLYDKIIKKGRFVGIALRLKRHLGLSVVIEKLGTQFDTANPDFQLYIYHTSLSDPVKTTPLNLTKDINFTWSLLTDHVLPYESNDQESGGMFFIGYYEDDLVGQAINKNVDLSQAPCSTCDNGFGLERYNLRTEYLDACPFEVATGNLPEDRTMWDVNQTSFRYDTNFGLNMMLTVKCDVTDFICQQKLVVAPALCKQVIADIVYEIAYNTRNNNISEQTKKLALFELNNRENGSTGLVKDVERAIAALDFDFSDMTSACLPCNQEAGIYFDTI